MLEAAVESRHSVSPPRPIGPHAIEEAEDDALFLLGRPPMAEDLGYLTTQVVTPERVNAREVADAWRAANDIVNALQTEEAGWANEPPLGELPAELLPARDRLMSDERFRRSMDVVPVDVKMVPLDRLVVPQKSVNLGSVERLSRQFSARRDPQSIFDLCLPIERPRETVRCLRLSNDSFMFVSPSHDFRYLDVMLLDPASLAGEQTRGLVAGAVGLMVGYSCNCLTAFAVQNRLVLINGTHRALALLQMGVTEAPCVIQTISRPEELSMLAPRDLLRNPHDFLSSPRPMLLKDFLDPRLCRKVRVSRRMRQVKVTFSVESHDAPTVE